MNIHNLEKTGKYTVNNYPKIINHSHEGSSIVAIDS